MRDFCVFHLFKNVLRKVHLHSFDKFKYTCNRTLDIDIFNLARFNYFFVSSAPFII